MPEESPAAERWPGFFVRLRGAFVALSGARRSRFFSHGKNRKWRSSKRPRNVDRSTLDGSRHLIGGKSAINRVAYHRFGPQCASEDRGRLGPVQDEAVSGCGHGG